MFRRFADWFDAHRRAVAVGLIVATAASLVGIARLEFDDVPRSIFRSDDEEFRRLEQVFHEFGADDADGVLLVEADDLAQPEAVLALRKLIDEVRAADGVADVRSVADLVVFPKRTGAQALTKLLKPVPTQPTPLLPELPEDGSPPTAAACRAFRDAAAKHPLARGRLISDDCRATLVVARLDDDAQAVRSLAPIVERLQHVAEQTTAGGVLDVRLTGLAPIRVDIFQSVQAESARFVIVGGSLTVVMALVLLRRPAAVAVVCLAAMLGAIWTIGLMGLTGERMNIITTVLPTLVMIIGFTDAVHLMIDIRRERAEGTAPRVVARRTLQHLGMACLLCAATMAIGFGSLACAQIEIIRRFGVLCAAGAVLSVGSALLLVPLLAGTRLGRHVRSAAEFDLPERIARLFEPLVRAIVARPKLTAAAGLIVTVAMCSLLPQLRPSNQATEALPTSRPSFAAIAKLDEHFGGSASAMILVEWDEPLKFDSPQVLEALDAVQLLAAANPDVRSPASLVNLVRSLPGDDSTLARQARGLHWVDPHEMRHYVRPDLRRALVHVGLQNVDSNAHLRTFDELRAGFPGLEAQFPGVRFHLTGTSVLASRNLNQMITDLDSSLGSAALMIFAIMAVGFRSFRLGLISILPNLFPMAATAAFLVLTGRPLQMTSVVVFSICLGIAVDDTIHFIHRFQAELRRDGDPQAAVLRTYRAVGSAMITTSMVLLVGFGSLQISEMPTTRLFSLLSCVTIFSALVGDLVILPALLCLFAKPAESKVSRAGQVIDAYEESTARGRILSGVR